MKGFTMASHAHPTNVVTALSGAPDYTGRHRMPADSPVQSASDLHDAAYVLARMIAVRNR